nr:retrovirus-related Pol polyprotein from transposon TNT 1-94 [Tanacetum cinerariifolium]
TGNISFISDFEEIDGGYVAFGGNPKGGKISGKGKIKTGKFDFNDVYFVKDLKFNLFSVSQMCYKKNIVLFTYTECVVLSSDYKLPDENHVLLRVPRDNNMYNVDLKNAEAVYTACYVQNRVLVTKPYNKTPYELLLGRSPSIGFMRPFGCHVTILNILDPLGKFDRKADEGFLVGYSVNSKAFRVFNSRTRIVQETLHINFLENKPNVVGIGPKWLFDIDTLTMSMYYQPVVAGNQPNDNAGIKENLNADPQNTNDVVADAAFNIKENENDVYVSANESDKIDSKKHDEKAKRDDKGKSPIDSPTRVRDLRAEFEEFSFNISNRVNAVSAPVNAVEPNPTNSTNNFNTASPSVNVVSLNFRIVRKSSFVDPSKYPKDPDMPQLEDIVYSDNEEDVDAEADLSNLETNISVSPIPTTRVHKDHPVNQIIGDLNSAPQTRSMTRIVKEQGRLHQINDEDFRTCMFACFLSQEEPKKVHQALKDPNWIKAMQKDLLQFKLQKVWVLVDLPKGKRAIGHTQEEGIDYDEVFAPVARIEAIRLFLVYASFMGFMVYKIDVKSDFLYGTIEEEVYVCQHPGFEDLDYLDKIDQNLFIKKKKGDILLVQVYVDDIIFGSTNKELCKVFEKLMKEKFQMSSMGELTFFLGLQVKQKDDGIFISQDKYVAEILRKFGFTYVRSASTPIEIDKPLLKDPDGEDVDVHIYKLMIRSLMYLTLSRPDIMFAICVCSRFQVTPKVSHLHAVKRIFRYLKGKSYLGLWYPKDSPFNLVAYFDSDYDGASLDRKSTTGDCQFLGCRLISWQCKKQTVISTSSTEAEYVVAASCCAQVLWIQNQILDYGSQVNVVEGITIYNLIDSLNHLRLQTFSHKTDHPLNPTSNFLLLLTNLNHNGTSHYALVVNPTIYVSCIKQFWVTATIKKVNDVVQLCALIDGKKVVVSEAIIQRDLHLDDVDGVECLPNEEIFEELARMGYEKPHTKVTFYKACSMASVVICLATGRKFNFSKYIFDSMVRNVDIPSKFLMYPRFLQVVMDNQVDDMTYHNTRYTSPALTQKVFANMQRVGKGFSRVKTPLFASMLVPPQPQAEEEEVKEQPTVTSESSMSLLTTLMETCATLSKKVADLEQDKHTQAMEILQLKKRVKKLEKKKRSKSSGLQRLKRVGTAQRVESSTDTVVEVEKDEEVVTMDAEPQGRINQEDVSAATKDVSAAEPTIFDDE